jgi:hypothetical protein
MDLTATHDALARTLDTPREELARRAARESFRRGLHGGVAALPRVAAVTAIGFFGGSYIVGQPLFWPWALPALMLIVPIAGGFALRSAARRSPPDAYDAALALDESHHNHDRLSAALELSADAANLGGEARHALARAAIEDGRASLARLDLARVAVPHEELRWRVGSLVFGLFLACLPALLLTLGDARRHDDDATTRTAQGTRSATDQPARTPETAERERRAPDAPGAEPAPTSAPRPAVRPKDRSQPNAADPKSSNAGAGSGSQPAPSDDAARASESAAARAAAKGAASNSGSGASGKGAAASEAASDETPKEAQRTNPPKPKEQRGAETEKNDKEPSSGSPSGASKGGGRLAAVGNERSGSDRGVEREDELDSEDEEIEDEKEESEQRGGVVPTKRDRRQAPSRELSISGNGPPDDGRGGPTPPKKSRGTASLVLGIRLPDQVRGRPNPGTAKTSIEPVPPSAAAAVDRGASANASDRASPHVQSEQPPIGERAAYLRRYHELVRTRTTPSTLPRNE